MLHCLSPQPYTHLLGSPQVNLLCLSSSPGSSSWGQMQQLHNVVSLWPLCCCLSSCSLLGAPWGEWFWFYWFVECVFWAVVFSILGYVSIQSHLLSTSQKWKSRVCWWCLMLFSMLQKTAFFISLLSLHWDPREEEMQLYVPKNKARGEPPWWLHVILTPGHILGARGMHLTEARTMESFAIRTDWETEVSL